MRNTLNLCMTGLLLVAVFAMTGCSSGPPIGRGRSPQELRQAACRPGKNVDKAEGTVWIKTKTSEFSGQFPANVAVSLPDQLKLEITNLLGGTEALITVGHDHYEVIDTRGKQSEKKDEGFGNWGGIPLRWATDLFLGKVPCPSSSAETRASVNEDGELTLLAREHPGKWQQKFIFEFKNRDGKPWPSRLHWEHLESPSVSVDFHFDDPEDETLSPQKWEAESQQGKVKVRWRDRNVSLKK